MPHRTTTTTNTDPAVAVLRAQAQRIGLTDAEIDAPLTERELLAIGAYVEEHAAELPSLARAYLPVLLVELARLRVTAVRGLRVIASLAAVLLLASGSMAAL